MGFHPLCFDLVVAVDFDEFLCCGRIVPCFERAVKVPKLLPGFGFVGAVTRLLEGSLALALFFVGRLLISALFVICHPLPHKSEPNNAVVASRDDYFRHIAAQL
jgi:hypothetical protein